MRILYTNADSLHNKLQELKIMISALDYAPHIIAITEVNSKSNNKSVINEFNILGYELYSTNLEEISRGILIYVDANLHSSINIIDSPFKEYLIVSVKCDNSDNLTICTVYRSPNSNLDNDNLLCPFINQVCNTFTGNVLIIGDFNIGDINWNNYTSISNSSSSLILLKAIRDNFLTQHIDTPTRARGSDTPHILDLVISNNPFTKEINHISPIGRSDHVCLEIVCDFDADTIDQVNRLNYSKGDYINLRKFLNVDWSTVLNPQLNDCETMWQIFKDKLSEGENLFVPLVKTFKPTDKSWKRPINVDLRNDIKEKKRTWNSFIKTRNPAILLKYKRLTNNIREQTRNIQKIEQKNIAHQCKTNPKKFWNYVNSKFKNKNKIGNLSFINNLGKEEVTDSDTIKTEVLNSFFSSVFVKEDNTNFTQLDNIPAAIPMENLIINEIDVLKRLDKLDKNKSPGPDGIHPRILFEVRIEIAKALKIIFNKSLLTHQVPVDWKAGNITPIFKKGVKTDASNYRPISLTSIVCKLFESIIRDHIVLYFNVNNLFSNKQYGFIKGRSTVLQLLKIMDDWTEMLEHGGQIDVIYTDFEKAFDKVPHNRLISKLHSYNINADIISWIKAYLENRVQRVRVNSCFSSWAKVESGIPQGSILGPLLFIIYINELPNICDSGSKLYLYADDAKIYKQIFNRQDRDNLQCDLNKLNSWADNWLLKLNIVKCKKISFGRHIEGTEHYNIDNVDLENVESIKDLGVIYDPYLKFDLHMSEKINKAYSILGIIKRNFKYLDKDSFLVMYKSLVRSHLEYANCIWSPHTVQYKKNVEKVQMRATKLLPAIKHMSYIDRLKHLNLPTLLYRRLRGDMIMVFKLLSGIYDSNIACNLVKSSNYVTRGHSLRLYKMHVHYDLRKYYFSNRVISIWNSLPDYVVDSNTISSFENSLDRFWINQACLFDYKADLTGAGSRSKL